MESSSKLGLFILPIWTTCPLFMLDRPSCLLDKEIFEYIWQDIRSCLSIFEVFLKNIQRICLVCPVCTRRNRQDCLLARSLGLSDSLRTPSMTTLITTIRKSWNYENKLYINNLSLRIYLVIIAWNYSKFKLNMKRTNIKLITSPLYSLGGC